MVAMENGHNTLLNNNDDEVIAYNNLMEFNT